MIGLLLVLHGSKIKEWQEIVINYAEELKRHFPLVEYGFIEINEPKIDEAAKKLVERGADTIVVVPLLFAAGMHFKRDIPNQLKETSNKAKIIIAEPIGFDKRIVDILKEKAEKALSVEGTSYQ
ncbi:CbiX/SirB N-terminal domain-containing protein [Sulfolobus acidocaldarius]|uniref:Sirohydrochlorin cobaltochelatase n=4 Tax=Sulfolobus acidocaldarius TaxID=2285 RepID=CBIX_SULAC|nr:CbiX/SirB N-terminal domain-containing protein [Sulfolobus acidocaldarius]Q4JAI2.1 RecName: Full=Sirohydrochlorin cobaltochelatase; AltName: Full=CbiXS [Sulfolobus acidocaldarius DSM 639]AAY80197.1 conserved Prokaryal protein [Sulfolobus acidocaldarius DSM 639]AGE70776.1 sirohydrochlorin cobaltochelatase [Sulfolobus acidocaldarius N8]AGE73047.1 sirohydrochlorin cobaltochelatase [Sulfolobus acidocaldarius Ron12/I]ALU28900.1 sirohydrochlorin cobaltochelatase [Sulfolobus acidocaldarius]ALU316